MDPLIREQVADLPPLPDGTSVADAITGQFSPMADRERLAQRAADPETRADTLRHLTDDDRSTGSPEWQALVQCIRRGLLDIPIRLDEARALRAVEPSAYVDAIQLLFLGDPAMLEPAFDDVARCGDPIVLLLWMTEADRANALDVVARLLMTGGQHIRLESDGWRTVLLGSNLSRSGLLLAEYFRRNAATDVPVPTLVKWLLGRSSGEVHTASLERLWSVDQARSEHGVALRIGIRRAVLDGTGEQALAWLDERGAGERWRPLREALASVVHGSEHLLTVAPEVRESAEQIAAWLSFRPEAYFSDAPSADAPTPKPTKKPRSVKRAAPRGRRTRSSR